VTRRKGVTKINRRPRLGWGEEEQESFKGRGGRLYGTEDERREGKVMGEANLALEVESRGRQGTAKRAVRDGAGDPRKSTPSVSQNSEINPGTVSRAKRSHNDLLPERKFSRGE